LKHSIDQPISPTETNKAEQEIKTQRQYGRYSRTIHARIVTRTLVRSVYTTSSAPAITCAAGQLSRHAWPEGANNTANVSSRGAARRGSPSYHAACRPTSPYWGGNATVACFSLCCETNGYAAV